uniref:PGPS/NH21 n=1 Tax=Solanum tuberosum TaxID=4113 RepID=M1B6A2_SOLTU
MKGVVVLLHAPAESLAGAHRRMQAWSTRDAHVESTVGAILAHVQRVKPLLERPTASAVLAAPVPPVPLKLNY